MLGILFTGGILVLAGLLSVFSPRTVSRDVQRLREMLSEDGHIIHAGGFLETGEGVVTYTNSLEALENLYAKGRRFCEIDLQETSDGMLICGHGDESELVFGTGLPTDSTGAEFLNSRIYGVFTPLSADGLCQFMETHPDLFVITDVKSDNLRVCRRIAEEHPGLRSQFIVQIQDPEEYEVLSSLGFRYIMYPIFKTSDSQRDVLSLASFAKNHDLVAMIVPNGYYSPDIKLGLAGLIVGIPIVLHTLNDCWEIDYYLDHDLATAVYTDLTDF